MSSGAPTTDEILSLSSVRAGLDYWSATSPDRLAVTDGRSHLTYAELCDRVRRRGQAAQVALRDAALGALLPVLVDRSIESCISLLACDYARVPYFPLDASTPPGLLSEILARTDSSEWVLAHSGLEEISLPDGTRALLDESASGDGWVEPWQHGNDHDRGLVVFTSGSTGRPKGVVFDWATRDARWRRRLSDPRRCADKARAVTVLPFDSAWGIDGVASIAVGYTLLIVDVRSLRPADLVRQMAAFGTTHMDMPPQLLRLIAKEPELEPLPDIEFIRVGSEPLRYEYLEGLRRAVPPSTLIEHAYGASECGWIFRYRFTISQAPTDGPAPIGRPIDEDAVRLDALAGGALEIRQVLATGAIALEYLDDPEQTAMRFEHSSSDQRWWRSGDLVLEDADGLLWHQGRMDDIVKVGGRLAAPNEAVSALLQIPGIRQAVVLPVDRGHNVRLVAHVELDPESTLSRADVKHALAAALPAYLIPSAILRHRVLPTTGRGKVDRLRLMEGPHEHW